MDNNEKSHYEGLFAPRPDEIQDGVWGTTETHRNAIGPDTRLERDWYGQVRSVDQSWVNW